MDYPGKVITKNAVIPTQTSAPGVWTLDDAAQAQKANSWPIPGVPNPISKSLRFNSADSAYLNRTPTIQGNRRTWTLSFWFKKTNVSSDMGVFAAGSTGTDRTYFFSEGNSVFQLRTVTGGTGYQINTAAVFRDPSAWYHVVAVADTTNATSGDRLRIYVNGVRQSDGAGTSYPPQNTDTYINSTIQHNIGNFTNTNNYVGGYMTEINFVDGQALTPSDFGMTDTVTGVWVPKKYTGTYGTNGFYLNFKDSTNTTTLGYDYSGNGNNWNANNFSVTAGAGNDSLTDVPTPWIGYALNTEAGGVVRGNYCTVNPLDNGGLVIANGNLDVSRTVGSWLSARTTFGITSDKWYWEFTATSNVDANNAHVLGLMKQAASIANYVGYDANGWGYLSSSGNKANSATGTAYGTSWGNGSVVGVAFDADAGTLVFYVNGVSQGTAFTGLTSGPYFPAVSLYGATLASGVFNFGQRPFAYTPPSGYKSLCTTNLPTPTVVQGDDYFNTVLYTGNNGTNNITGVGFQPDFIWLKSRSNAESSNLVDVIRGAGKVLRSNTTGAEQDLSGSFSVSSFNSDGFTVIGIAGESNQSGYTYAAWNWKANGAGVTNTAGTITSTVSANTTSGFSIVTYTGAGAPATVGHGLGVAPSMIIVKGRNITVNWVVYHASITNPRDSLLYLDSTSAVVTSGGYWGSSGPSSTTFGVGALGGNNQNSSTYVAYCFAPVAGYSAFGSYTGNGSTDGPFVYTGFRPAYLLIKNASTGSTQWLIVDAKRNTYNVVGNSLLANLSDAESTGSTWCDFLSNGLKIRNTSASTNTNGNTYIYAAFAENPFKFANAR